MNTSTEQPGISRRQLLRYGLLGTLVLATAGGIASVTRTLRSGPGTGYRQLRESHIPMLRRIIPVILEGALPAGEADAAVSRARWAGPEPGPPSRPCAARACSCSTCSVWISPRRRHRGLAQLENATSEQVQTSLALGTQSSGPVPPGYGALNQAILLVWYGQPLPGPIAAIPARRVSELQGDDRC